MLDASLRKDVSLDVCDDALVLASSYLIRSSLFDPVAAINNFCVFSILQDLSHFTFKVGQTSRGGRVSPHADKIISHSFTHSSTMFSSNGFVTPGTDSCSSKCVSRGLLSPHL